MIKYANNSCASPVMTVILITRENIKALLFILSSEQTLLSSNSKEVCFIVLNRIRGLERLPFQDPCIATCSTCLAYQHHCAM